MGDAIPDAIVPEASILVGIGGIDAGETIKGVVGIVDALAVLVGDPGDVAHVVVFEALGMDDRSIGRGIGEFE